VAAPTTQDLNVDKGSNISDVHDFGIQDSILQMAPFFWVEQGRLENDEGEWNTKMLQSISRTENGI